ncbi:ATP-binding protein [Natronolimnohabitans sp. A-GB9]|uniref:ATP-binding protein n=1 Tax=Natronolimnohabitans sp. A-GB9 TaxID=3069757 RepID=UPI0027B625CA|nr:ATP-binding protein [Natronolimnohabitans sp. A-GB9]MDQ2049628.1 ATP-binding protein [Natronolimnohabitans sp. A-GB9]
MVARNRLRSPTGARRAIGVLGGLYIALAVGLALVQLRQGTPLGNVVIVTLLIVIPGFGLSYGSQWLSRSDIDPEFYPTVFRWCLGGFGAIASILVLYHLQPAGGITTPETTSSILTALGTLAGFAVGSHDGRAKTRTRELEQRNRELEKTQAKLEETVQRLEETNIQLEGSNERLERYREYTDEVLDSIHDVFYVLEADGTLVRWNESLEAATGYDNADISSMTAAEFFTPDDSERVTAAVAEGFETGSVQLEANLLTSDGERIPYEFAASKLETPAGESVLAGIGRDISERKTRERTLEKRAHQQRVVADLGQFALETDDLDELMREASRKVAAVLDTDYCKVLDLDTESEALLLRQGVGWNDGLVGEATVSAVEANSQAAYTLEADRPVVVEDLESETRFSGPQLLRDHDVHSGVSTVIGPFDEPWGILGIHDTERRTFTEDDVTFVKSVANVLAEAIERRQYRDELETLIDDLEESNVRLEESNERLEQFAYAASHDLQEPLRMVSTYLQLIERRYGDELDEEGEEFLEFAVDGADRMRSMVDGLLQYARVETGGEPFEPVDLEAVLEGAREDLRMRIEESDAEITVDTLPRVEGDSGQLRQVFQNLLSNAIRYSGDEPPRVHVSAERNGTEWTVSVTDAGIGIDPDDQELIFEIFEGLPGDDEYVGTGIGLAVCERIVERHGGEIWVDSEPGSGATFSFTLPAATDDRPPSVETERRH